jgi:DNA-binding HxlR family transcriptional regulator
MGPALSTHTPDGWTEGLILDLLLEPRREPWLVGELTRAIGRPVAVAEALEALQTAGLVERHGEAIALSRA